MFRLLVESACKFSFVFVLVSALFFVADAESQNSVTKLVRVMPVDGSPDFDPVDNESYVTSVVAPLVVEVRAGASVKEGDDVVFTVVLTGGVSTQDIVVPLTYAGTASSGIDYLGFPNFVVIESGESFATVSFPSVEDAVVEVDESVSVTVGSNTGYILGGVTTAEVVIQDFSPAQSLGKLVTDDSTDGAVAVGDVLTYTVTMTNTGNTTLTGVVVSDALITPNSITCPNVAPGATCQLVGTYTVTQADADAGNLRNTAVV
ncbi:hypothetical protein, partial [Microseira sp. BLCC-F43]|uniref:DUF7507 domain-containing protein n=1 Tax=Microseira sp. BLCC-F43 TaxID=3153602 RepID=UPI0035B91CAB